MESQYEAALNRVNTCSCPSDLKITDIRFTDIVGAPMDCTLMKIYTPTRAWSAWAKSGRRQPHLRFSAEKPAAGGKIPCNVDKLFRRIKQFGGVSRQAGGVCGVEGCPVGFGGQGLRGPRLSAAGR